MHVPALICVLMLNVAPGPIPEDSIHVMSLFMEGVEYQMQYRVNQEASSYRLGVSRLKDAYALAPENSVIALTLAETYYDHYKYEEALEILQQLLERQPEHTEALCMVAEIYALRHEYATALEYYSSANKLDPNNPEIMIPFAHLHYLTNNPEAAVELMKGIDHPKAYWLLATHHLKENNLAEAERYFRSYLRFDADNIRVMLTLSDILEKEGKYSEAASVLFAHLRKLPERTRYMFRCAQLFRRGGECTRAIPLFEELLSSSKNPSEVEMELGRCYVEAGKLLEAQQRFRRVLTANPENVLAQLYLIYIKFLQGHMSESLSLLNKLENKNLQEEARHFLLNQKAELYTYMGNWEAAEATYFYLWQETRRPDIAEQIIDLYERISCHEKALDFLRAERPNLDSFTYLNSTAKFLLLSGQEDAGALFLSAMIDKFGEAGYYFAVQNATEAKQYALANRFIDEWQQISNDSRAVLYARGAILENQGKRAEAKQLFWQLLKDWPDDPDSLNYLGYMLAEEGKDLKKAHEYLTRALNMEAQNGAFLDSMGWILFKMGKWKEAKEYLTRALHKVPHDPTIIEHLADTYAQMKKHEQALFYYKLAIKCYSEKTDSIIQKIISLR